MLNRLVLQCLDDFVTVGGGDGFSHENQRPFHSAKVAHSGPIGLRVADVAGALGVEFQATFEPDEQLATRRTW